MPDDLEYAFETSGGAVFSGSRSGCSGLRYINGPGTLTMPKNGADVKVWAGVCSSETAVKVTPTFVLKGKDLNLLCILMT